MMAMHNVPISSAFHRSITIPVLRAPFLLLVAGSSISVQILDPFVRFISPLTLPPFPRKADLVNDVSMHPLILRALPCSNPFVLVLLTMTVRGTKTTDVSTMTILPSRMVVASLITIPTLRVLRMHLPYPPMYWFGWFQMTSVKMMIDVIGVAGRPRALRQAGDLVLAGAAVAHHGIHGDRLNENIVGVAAPLDGLLVVPPGHALSAHLVDDATPHSTGAGFMFSTAAAAAHLDFPAGVRPRIRGPSSVDGCRRRRLSVSAILGRVTVGFTSPQSSGCNPSPELLDALSGSPGPASGVVLSAPSTRLPPVNRGLPSGSQGPA